MIVQDKKDYIRKAEKLIGQNDTYTALVADPAKKQRNELINILKIIKLEGGLGDNTCEMMYPYGVGTTSYMSFPKFARKDKSLIPQYPEGVH